MIIMKRLFLPLTFFLLTGCSAPDEKPNILWITSEDNGTFLGCYGDKVASTPNLDGLAEKGVRFTRCFANAPVCAPVRSSWIMGMPAVTNGTHQMRSRYRISDALRPYPLILKEAGYYVTNNSKTDYNTSSFGKEIWDECSNTAHYKNRSPGTPFFAVFNITLSHEGQIFGRHYPGKYPEVKTPAEEIKIPPYQVNTPEVLLDWQRMYDRIHDMDREVGRILSELDESGEAENTIVLYCSDHAGITLRSKRYLHNSGTHVPFIVYVPEKWKHLAPGTPGSASDRLVQFIDMPKTILSLAGAEIPEYMSGMVIMGRDEEPPPETVFLFSGRFDESPDMSRAVTDGRWRYIRNYEPDRPRFQLISYPLNQSGQLSQWQAYQKGLTDPMQSAHYRPQPPEELYNTGSDPHEVHNMAGDPAAAGELKRLRGELDRHILEYRDAGFIPEPMMAEIDRDSTTSLYDYCQSAEQYPLQRIMEAAWVASRQDAGKMDELRSFAESEIPEIRYWAMVGFRALGKKAMPALELIEKSLEDPEPSVRITAAVALGNLGETEKALPLLLNEARRSDTDAWANWALDGIKYLDAPETVEGIPMEDLVRGNYSRRSWEQLSAGGSMTRLPRPE
jgi:arylsulfatase A-like enzyme